MSSYLRKIKKRIEQERSDEEKRILAVAEWIDTYGHNYPGFTSVAHDPVQSVLDMMKSHDLSVVQAAEACELFAAEWVKEQDGE